MTANHGPSGATVSRSTASITPPSATIVAPAATLLSTNTIRKRNISPPGRSTATPRLPKGTTRPARSTAGSTWATTAGCTSRRIAARPRVTTDQYHYKGDWIVRVQPGRRQTRNRGLRSGAEALHPGKHSRSEAADLLRRHDTRGATPATRAVSSSPMTSRPANSFTPARMARRAP